MEIYLKGEKLNCKHCQRGILSKNTFLRKYFLSFKRRHAEMWQKGTVLNLQVATTDLGRVIHCAGLADTQNSRFLEVRTLTLQCHEVTDSMERAAASDALQWED